MDHDETGCQAPPETPVLRINNCGFFGSPDTMNMCSKFHKDSILKQEQAKLAASSIENFVNGSLSSHGTSSNIVIEPIVVSTNIDVPTHSVATTAISVHPSFASTSEESVEEKPKEGPKRCTSCNKRVGLTGFSCRCGDIFCALHRYSEKHNCPFDYRVAGRDAIAKANPVVKAEKLDKI